VGMSHVRPASNETLESLIEPFAQAN